MHQAVFNSTNFKQNDFLDLQSPHNRDNCLEPYRLIADILKKNNIDLVTPDVLHRDPIFEIQIEKQNKSYSKKKFLIQLENPEHTFLPKKNNDYLLIFSWNEKLYSHFDSFEKVFIPSIDSRDLLKNNERQYKYVMICANKKFKKNIEHELYSHRKNIIEWFSNNDMNNFFLFGKGWKYPNEWQGIKAYIKNFLKPLKTPKVFQGEIINKSDILSSSVFSFCYENMSSDEDYITEKIFDAMLSGCIPIYLGSKKISNHIPKEAFIDVRNFNDIDEIYNHTSDLTDDEILKKREAIYKYLSSPSSLIFRNDYFASSIVDKILSKINAKQA